MGNSKNSPHLTPWLSSQQIARSFEEILAFYPPGILGANWWVLFECTHTLPGGYDGGELVGALKKHPECACWVSLESLDGFFYKELTLYLAGSRGVN